MPGRQLLGFQSGLRICVDLGVSCDRDRQSRLDGGYSNQTKVMRLGVIRDALKESKK